MICQRLTQHPADTLCSLVFGLVHHECDVVFQPVLCWFVASSRRLHAWQLLPVSFQCEHVCSETRLVSQGCTSAGRMAGMWLCSCTQCKKHSAELSGKRPPTRPGSQPAAQRDLGWKFCRGIPGTSALCPAWQCPSPNAVSRGWHCITRGGACGGPEAPCGKSTWWLCRPHDNSMGDPIVCWEQRAGELAFRT